MLKRFIEKKILACKYIHVLCEMVVFLSIKLMKVLLFLLFPFPIQQFNEKLRDQTGNP